LAPRIQRSFPINLHLLSLAFSLAATFALLVSLRSSS
jgi:hypothetical protein